MECKAGTVTEQRCSVNRINRNIVECKGSKHTGSKWNVVSINRNIVECKESIGKNVAAFYHVLIETLWNVKHSICGRKRQKHTSINRNIVECKVYLSLQSFQGVCSINRNIVECKV